MNNNTIINIPGDLAKKCGEIWIIYVSIEKGKTFQSLSCFQLNYNPERYIIEYITHQT